ncbi:hypothetical protein [Paenibacillus validus]|uniref:hypothetical protein n=1 Tax=Paenibacillus validus TaxID=44253 RepID=UPI003D2A5F0E
MSRIEAKKQFYMMYPKESSNIELQNIQRAKTDKHIMKHVSPQYIDEFEAQLMSDTLQYSNDTRCDIIMNNVIKCSEITEITLALEQTFIGFIDQSDFNNARAKQRYHDGSCLVIIGRNIILDLIHISEIITLRYIQMFQLVPSVSDTLLNEWRSKLILKRTLSFDAEGFELSLIQNDPEEYFIGISAAILDAAIAFIIGHECGHHFLNHTKNPYSDSEFAQFMKSDWKNSLPQLSDRHIKEFEADIFASFFTFKFIEDIRIRSCIPQFDFAQEAGFIVAAIHLFLNKSDPTMETLDHPSPFYRYKLIMTNLKSLYGPDKSEEMKTLVTWICEESGFADTQKWERQWWSQ